MYFAYVDESGDSGYPPTSPSTSFVLALVLVHTDQWLHALDRLHDMRTYLRDKYGVPPQAELKANYLIQNKGVFLGLRLSPKERLEIYRLVMRFQREEGCFRTFGVVINKGEIRRRDIDPRDFAWRLAIERLQTFCDRQDPPDHVQIFPDAGHGHFIRQMVRRMRRFHYVPSAFGNEHLEAKALRILEDPSDRDSKKSYFVQLADLNAYAALRKVHPTRRLDGRMWDELGDARVAEVSGLKERAVATGIKVFPPPKT